MRFFKQIKNNLSTLKNTVAQIDKSKGPRFFLFFDVIYCKLRFHTSANEYLSYHFYDYKNCFRKNFLLKYHQVHIYRRINNITFTRFKSKLIEKIHDLVQREIILVPACGEAAFLDFVKKHNVVVIKPDRGSCGVGVEKLEYESDEQVLEFFRDIKKDMLCEEYIHQHKSMNSLNPSSVNTLRIVSMRHDEHNIEIISATLKAGSTVNSFTDNLYGGGIVAEVDVESGIVSTFGFDKKNNRYTHHPVTQTQFIGFNIPNWLDVVTLVKKAHSRLDENKIVGWDVAVTEKGADIVEANSAPSPMVMQITDGKPKGEKILKILNNKKNHIYND